MTTPHYVTHDTYLSAFVLNQGASLAGHRRIGPKKVEFRFLADRRLHELLRLYWSEARDRRSPPALRLASAPQEAVL